METAIVNNKGEITIPNKYRKKYGISTGTKVGFVEKDGQLIIKVLNKEYFESLTGWLKDENDLLGELMREKKIEREL